LRREILDESRNINLLRRFEPIIRYTRGERFFPMDVERYIRRCSLWVQIEDDAPKMLVSQENMNLDILSQPRREGFGAVYYLKFIDPPDLLELARYRLDKAVKSITKQEDQNIFRAGLGRLARVGYGSRLVDALFSLTLLLRGRVPGDTADAAWLAYHKMQEKDERYTYYGRVFRENGWVILQYWYFYPFNNWRSGFFGVNDHEGDWEMVSVYCYDEDYDNGDDPQVKPDNLKPRWAAYASHDYSGDDLRRRWDDPELEKLGEHPVVYAGAGSHASYFAGGEYLAEIELPFLSPLVRLVDWIQGLWGNIVGQNTRTGKPQFNVFRIPFVDYARGDGDVIGCHEDKAWEVRLIDENTPWAVHYRGLWGLYAQDPISGENAPAGPVYRRDGSVRRSWYDPLGWAGLDKVVPPNQALSIATRERANIKANIKELTRLVKERSTLISSLGVEAAAMEGHAHLEQAYKDETARIGELSDEIGELREQLTIEKAKLQSLEVHEGRLQRGDFGDPRSHIQHAHRPSPEADLRLGGLAEIFAAISIGLLMVGIVLLFVFARNYLLIGMGAMLGFLFFVEASFRRRLASLISSLTVGLAIISALVVIFEIFIMWENLREVFSR